MNDPVSAARNIHMRAQRSISVPLCLAILGCWLHSSASPVVGHEGHPPPAAKPAEVYKPTVLPDRIILTWAGDPETTQAVTWRTSVEVSKALAEIAVAEAGPGFPKTAKQVAAVSQSLLTDLSTAHFHAVNFQELSPATKYAYRVGDGVNW